MLCTVLIILIFSTEHTSLNSWEEMITKQLYRMTYSGLYNDTIVICCDGQVMTPRTVLSCAYPTLYTMLKSQGDADTVTLLMPEYRCTEIESRIYKILTHLLSDTEDCDDTDYIPRNVDESISDTEILGEGDELQEELRCLSEDTSSCTCCTACKRQRGKTGRKSQPFHSLSISGRNRRVAARLKARL